MELPVSLDQFLANCRIVEARQSSSRHGIEELLVEQLLAKRPQIGRTVIDQRLQRDFAGAEICMFVERDFLHGIQSAAIAKKHAEPVCESHAQQHHRRGRERGRR